MRVDTNLDRILYGKIRQGGHQARYLGFERYPLTYRQKTAISLYTSRYINEDLLGFPPRIITYSDPFAIPRFLELINSAIDILGQKRLKVDTAWFTLRFDPLPLLDKNNVWHLTIPLSTSVGHSKTFMSENGSMYSCELRDPCTSERHEIEGAFIGDINPNNTQQELLVKSGVYLRLVHRYNLIKDKKIVKCLVFEHLRVESPRSSISQSTSSSIIPFQDNIRLIYIKERIDVGGAEWTDKPDLLDYYGRNIYFLSILAQSQTLPRDDIGGFVDRYTKAKDAYGDFGLLSNTDKYNRDIGFYVRIKPRNGLDPYRRDVYGNTPLMYKLLANDMHLMTTYNMSKYMLHTAHLYSLDNLLEANDDGLMPITMFDSMDILLLDDIEPYLTKTDSLGRTSLHRLVMMHVGFFVTYYKSGNLKALVAPHPTHTQRLKELRDSFDYDARDIYDKAAIDYYKPMREVYGGFLDILFYPDASMDITNHLTFIPPSGHNAI